MDFLEPLTWVPGVVWVPLLVGSFCAVLHYVVYGRRLAAWRKAGIPYLKPSFLIGHKYFWQVRDNSCLVPIDRIYQESKDKDLVGFFIATMPVVLVRNPALIKQIFAKNFDKTFETGFAASEKDKIAQHMLNLCTDKGLWKSGRNTLSPMFSTARVSGDRFNRVMNQIQQMWAHVEETRLQGTPINTKQVAMNFIQDGTSNSFFGLDANSYEKKGDLLNLVESIAEPGWCRLLSAFAQMQFQGIQFLESFKFITQNHIDSMKSLIQKQMTHRTQTNANGNKNDFIDLLIRQKEQDQDQDRKLNSEMDVTNEMIGLGLSLIFGRNESTAMLSSFTLHLLSLHPEYQERVTRELEEAMKKHNTTEITYEVVRELHFLDQCLHETARLYPNVAALTRVCTEDLQLAGTDYTLKKGERIMIDPYSVHRDPEYFENPEVFNPDRFSPKNRTGKAVDAFLGFGSGPRKCPGYKVGFLMASTLIGSLLHKYEVRPRSHAKQMDAHDFHPRSFVNVHRDDILVDVVPRLIAAY